MRDADIVIFGKRGAIRPRVAIILLVAILLQSVIQGIAPQAARANRQAADRSFWVFVGSRWQRLGCDELGQGAHVTIFSCPGTSVASTQVAAMIDAFQRRIFSTDSRLFGLPRHLGQVNIVLVPLSGMTIGYFDENDLLFNGNSFDPKHSNHANILYVRPPDTMPDADKMAEENEAVAHELQHLFEFRIRVLDHGYFPQDDWLNEGLSFYAQVANGYWTPRDQMKMGAAAATPGWRVTSLNEGSAFLRHHARTSYGRAGLFMTYLGARYGSSFTRRIVANPRPGLPAIDEVLHSTPYRTSLAAAFASWGVAALLNQPGTYGYRGLVKGRAAPAWAMSPVRTYPFDTARSLPPGIPLDPWAHGYLEFQSKEIGILQLTLRGAPRCFRVGAVLETSGSAADTTVRWFNFDAAGTARLAVPAFGQRSQRLTLVISHVASVAYGSDSGPVDHLRVQASLVRMLNPDRST
ncbi:MAG: hypothetical protein M3Z66_06075 [Chloroflexota bacterium]|nr:hypothetical protein [Chloroflexota bacterium]